MGTTCLSDLRMPPEGARCARRFDHCYKYHSRSWDGMVCYIGASPSRRCLGYNSFLFAPAVPLSAQPLSRRAVRQSLESVLPSSWDPLQWQERTLWSNYHMIPNRGLKISPLGGTCQLHWIFLLWKWKKIIKAFLIPKSIP